MKLVMGFVENQIVGNKFFKVGRKNPIVGKKFKKSVIPQHPCRPKGPFLKKSRGMGSHAARWFLTAPIKNPPPNLLLYDSLKMERRSKHESTNRPRR
jgi:hypothetical protein